jgi:hypothetical protein
VPGGHTGACAASAVTIGVHRYTSDIGMTASTCGRPAWWLSSQRTGTAALPAAANSGQ